MAGADSRLEKTRGPLWQLGLRRLLFFIRWAGRPHFEVIAFFKPA